MEGAVGRGWKGRTASARRWGRRRRSVGSNRGKGVPERGSGGRRTGVDGSSPWGSESGQEGVELWVGRVSYKDTFPASLDEPACCFVASSSTLRTSSFLTLLQSHSFPRCLALLTQAAHGIPASHLTFLAWGNMTRRQHCAHRLQRSGGLALQARQDVPFFIARGCFAFEILPIVNSVAGRSPTSEIRQVHKGSTKSPSRGRVAP